MDVVDGLLQPLTGVLDLFAFATAFKNIERPVDVQKPCWSRKCPFCSLENRMEGADDNRRRGIAVVKLHDSRTKAAATQNRTTMKKLASNL